MFRSFAFTSPAFTFLLFQSIFFTVQALECVDLNEHKTRVFKSLVELQGNKIPFNAQLTNQGNYVAFGDGNLDTLYKNSFVTFDSPYIRKIFLDDHQIRVIEDGAFYSLACVMVLNLQKNRIETITSGVFNGLRSLHELDLGENNIKEVPERVFISNVRLRKLNLTSNSIKVLHPDSFFKLQSLEELDLSNNHLRRVLPDTLQYFGKLTNLQLGSNDIERLDLERWFNVTKLAILNLSDNGLESFDPAYDFCFSASLTELYLNGNLLTHLNPLSLRKHLPSLNLIDLNDNPWACSDLHPLLQTLNDSRLSYGGNSNSDPNVGGIACNRSLETYKKTRWVEVTPEASTTTSTSPSPPHFLDAAPANSLYLTDAKILESVKSLQTTIVCLFIIVVVFIFVDVAVRSGCLSALLRRRRHGVMLDNSDVEEISLLRERF